MAATTKKAPMATSNVTQIIGKKGKRVRETRCITYPNRTRLRLYRPKDAGRIVCRILAQSAGTFGSAQSASTIRTELRAELDRCFPCTEQARQPSEQFSAAMAAAAQSVVSDNAKIIAIALAVLVALALVPRIIPFLPRVGLALLPAAARTALSQIPVLIARLRGQQAANDAFFRVLQGLGRAA